LQKEARMAYESKPAEGYSAFILLALLVIVAGYSVFYGLQTVTLMNARHWGTVEPSLYDTPHDLDLKSTPAAQTSHVEIYNYQCDLPWKGPAQTEASEDATDFKFPSGAFVRVYVPESQVDNLKTFKGETPEEQRRIDNMFGAHPFSSNFDLYSAVYEASPAQISPFMSRGDAQHVSALLIWKLNYDMVLPGGVLTFDAGPVRGLQFGNPEQAHAVVLRAFGVQDRQFEFLILMRANATAKLAQNDINLIIASLKPIPLPGQ
jgi:hypothetical protein